MNKIIRNVVSIICAVVLSLTTIAVMPAAVLADNTGNDNSAKDNSHVHSYTIPCEITKIPTATSSGLWSFMCSCGNVKTVTIPAVKDSNVREGTYRIAAKSSNNMYLSVRPGQAYSGGDIALYSKGNADQEFELVHNSDGTYTIYYGSLCFDVSNAAYEGNLQLYYYNGSSAQKWYIVSVGDGYYRLVTKATYYNIDITNDSMTDGANVSTYWNTDLNQQYFKLELIECKTHTWDDGTVTKQPEIGSTGVRTYTCTGCGHTKTEIIPALISISDASVSVDCATYIGTAVTPDVTVTLNSKTLVKDTDYTVTYLNNDSIGTGSVTITGIGAYAGTKTINFEIKEPTYSWTNEGDNWYLYDNTGRMITGFMTLKGFTYYMDTSGVMQTGWKQIDGAWYYFNSFGPMQTGWQQLGGVWYCFDNSGRMLTDWQQIGGVWFYFGGTGSMKTGWQKIGGAWYYFDSNGHMAKGWQKISNAWYYFGDSGSMKTGWQKVGGTWYYFASSGSMQTGWLKLSGKWYWLGTDGSMAYSTSVTLSGKTYNFDLNGVCLNP